MTTTRNITESNVTAEACKLLVPVVFNYGMRAEFILLPGSVVEWEHEDGNLIRVRSCGYSKVIHIDNAIPVEWDEDEEMWVAS